MSSTSAASRFAARAFHPFDLRQARVRLLFSIFLGIALGAILALVPRGPVLAVRLIAGWDTTGLTLTSLAWAIIVRADEATTRHRAAAEDPGRTLVWAIVLIGSTFSVFASFVVLRRAKVLAPREELLLIGFSLAAVMISWALTHTAYTLRYAHLYYRDDGEGEGGLTFPGDKPPDYFDFAYFAFTVGMCFQVSDVIITGRSIRRAVLGHSVLSFAYNTAILALALNLVFGML